MTMAVLGEGRAGTVTPVTEPRGLLSRLLRNEVARFAAGGLLAACLVGVGAALPSGTGGTAQCRQVRRSG